MGVQQGCDARVRGKGEADSQRELSGPWFAWVDN